MDLQFFASEGDQNSPLGSFLRRQGISMSLLRTIKYVENGIMVNGQWARTNQRLQAGDMVNVSMPPEIPSLVPQQIPLDIVWESAHAMVVDKPAGLVMHPTRSHKEGTLANAFAGLMRNRKEELLFRPVGRLDAGTSGLVLLAMNAFAAPVLAKSMHKTYYALVEGYPPAHGSINAPIGPRPDSFIKQWVNESGSSAVTNYKVLAQGDNVSLLEIRLETGRTHQIRVHFSHIGHPLIGDSLYGGEAVGGLERQALHCGQLAFSEPQAAGKIHVASPLPADMRMACEVHGIFFKYDAYVKEGRPDLQNGVPPLIM